MPRHHQWAGFVLAGGMSSRMGRHKALLPFEGKPLAVHVGETLAELVDPVVLVGDPAVCGNLGFPVVPDDVPGLGPLGGIITALNRTGAEWNLIAACDMPALTPQFIADLIDRADRSIAACVIPEGPHGLEPLCAAYRRDCRTHLAGEAARGTWKLRDALDGLSADVWRVEQAEPFLNLNTPGQWDEFLKRETRGPAK